MSKEQMKLVCMDAIRELIRRRDEDLCNLIAEELEDAGMVKAMDEAQNAKRVSEAAVYKILKSKK